MAGFGQVLAACCVTALSVGGARAQTAPARVDWPTYGRTDAREAANPAEKALAPSTVAHLAQRWATRLDGGAITAQPIVAAGITTAGGVVDLVVVGTETGRVAALDAATGTVVWSHDTGYTTLGCGDLPDGRFGISATAVFSRAEGRVYAMGGDGRVYAYAVGTGATVPGWPVTIVPDASTEHVYGGLTLDRGGLFATTASMCDNNTYHGRIARVQTRNPPGITHVFYVDGTKTTGTHVTQYGSGAGGLWGPGGVSIDTAGSTHPVFVATGNLLHSRSEHDKFGDQVVELGEDLVPLAQNYPGLPNPESDVDFGSTPVLYQMLSSCPPSLAAINKNGLLFTYDRTAIGLGPTQRIDNNSYAGDVAYDHDRRQLIVSNLDRVEAWRLGADCKLVRAWSRPETSGPGGELGQAVSPPTVANGVAYYGNGAGATLIAIDAASGAGLFSQTLGGSIVAAPTVVNGQVFVSAWDGKVYAFGP